MNVDAAIAGTTAARDALAAAERERDEAQRAEERAVVDLADAGLAYGDVPDASTLATWRKVREARELATLVLAGTERRLVATRAALREAELQEGRARLAEALPRADRGAMFARLASPIATLARLAIVPEADPFAPVTDEQIIALLHDQAERDVARKLARRTVRRELTAQAAAVDAARAAAAILGQRLAPDVAATPEEHVDAGIVLESYILGAPARFDPDWWPTWTARFYGAAKYPGAAAHELLGWDRRNQLREALSTSLDAWIAWGRQAYTTGNVETAAREIGAAREDAAREAMEAAAPGPFVDGLAPS